MELKKLKATLTPKDKQTLARKMRLSVRSIELKLKGDVTVDEKFLRNALVLAEQRELKNQELEALKKLAV